MVDNQNGSPVAVTDQDVLTTAKYVTVNVNTTGTTDLLDPSAPRRVMAVRGEAATASSTIDVEITDGTSTAKLEANTDGDDVTFGDTIDIDSSQKLQANVTSSDTDTDTTVVVLHAAVDNVFDE